MGQNLISFTEDFDKNMQIATSISKSGAIPSAYRGKPMDILVASQMGADVGLTVLQSLQNIAVINGQPCMWGDAVIGVVKNSQFCEYIIEEFDEKTMTATCRTKRKDEPNEVVRTFSKEDSITAGLWDERKEIFSQKYNRNIPNPAPWARFPKRMLQMRARGFCLRDTYPDALKGLKFREEVEEYEHLKEINPMDDSQDTPENTENTQTSAVKDKIKQKQSTQKSPERPVETIDGEAMEVTAKEKTALKGKITRCDSETEMLDLAGELAMFTGTEWEEEVNTHWKSRMQAIKNGEQ